MVSGLLAKVENLMVPIHPLAKVIVNERTGTIVMGQDGEPGGLLHPARQSFGGDHARSSRCRSRCPTPRAQTQVVPQTTVKATESPARRIELREGASVDDLINGLQAIGATPRDIVAILEAIRAAGALQAELEII